MDFFQNEIFEDKTVKGVGCWRYAQICWKQLRTRVKTGNTGRSSGLGRSTQAGNFLLWCFSQRPTPKWRCWLGTLHVVIFYRELEANSDCGLVKIMNLRRVQSDAQYLLREVKFHWRKAFQPAFPWCLCWCPYFTDGEAKARRSEPASPVRQLAVSNCGS